MATDDFNKLLKGNNPVKDLLEEEIPLNPDGTDPLPREGSGLDADKIPAFTGGDGGSGGNGGGWYDVPSENLQTNDPTDDLYVHSRYHNKKHNSSYFYGAPQPVNPSNPDVDAVLKNYHEMEKQAQKLAIQKYQEHLDDAISFSLEAANGMTYEFVTHFYAQRFDDFNFDHRHQCMVKFKLNGEECKFAIPPIVFEHAQMAAEQGNDMDGTEEFIHMLIKSLSDAISRKLVEGLINEAQDADPQDGKLPLGLKGRFAPWSARLGR